MPDVSLRTCLFRASALQFRSVVAIPFTRSPRFPISATLRKSFYDVQHGNSTTAEKQHCLLRDLEIGGYACWFPSVSSPCSSGQSAEDVLFHVQNSRDLDSAVCDSFILPERFCQSRNVAGLGLAEIWLPLAQSHL